MLAWCDGVHIVMWCGWAECDGRKCIICNIGVDEQ